MTAADELGIELFGTETCKTSLRAVEKITGISRYLLNIYKERPETMPIDHVGQIADAVGKDKRRISDLVLKVWQS